jgi:hypothetical protein
VSKYFSVILFCILWLTGCASASGPKFSSLTEPETNQAVVYVYRPEQFENSGLYPTVHLNNNPTKNLRNGGYLVFKVAPGKHTVSTVNEGVMKWAVPINPIEFEAKAGEKVVISMLTTYKAGSTYYTGIGTQFASEPGDRRGRFIIVPSDIAAKELTKLNQSN